MKWSITKRSHPFPGGAFLTGSRAYGTPHETSDVDIVLHTTTKSPLYRALMGLEDSEYDGVTLAIKSGDLNLIVVNRVKDYACWAVGTCALSSASPVTRDDAIKVFRALRSMRQPKWVAGYKAWSWSSELNCVQHWAFT